MAVMKVILLLDDEKLLEAETEDQPLRELRPLFQGIVGLLNYGVTEDTNLTPLD